MRKKSSKDSRMQIRSLRVRLFEAAADIDHGDDVVFDCKGPSNPYEQLYDRHGVSDQRPRRHR